MRVVSADINLRSSHNAQVRSETTSTLQAWVDPQRDQTARRPTRQPPVVVRVSESAQRGAAHAAKDSVAADRADASSSPDEVKLAVLRAFVERLTGARMQLFDARELSQGQGGTTTALSQPPRADQQRRHNPQAEQRAGYGVSLDVSQSYREVEQTRFAAAGNIRTADGKTLQFQLTLSESRSFEQHSSLSLRAGDAQRKDPLVLNFSGTAAQLTDARFQFDIDADGVAEALPMLANGNGFLALDVNGNGRIDSGKELFGAQSGDGFADLAAYDVDHNQVIDENDPIFARLRIWSPDPNDAAGKLSTLQEHKVGALLLGHADTPFTLRSSNAELGAVRSTGVYLSEAGTPGLIQQVDLVV